MLSTTTCPKKKVAEKDHKSISHQEVFQLNCSTTSNKNSKYGTSAEPNAFQTPDKDVAIGSLSTIDGRSEPVELRLYEPWSASAIKETARDIQCSLKTRSTNSHSNSKSKKSDSHKSSICRTNDHENAFHQIEDVHNYSKLNSYRYNNRRNGENDTTYSCDSSNQEEDNVIHKRQEEIEENYRDSDIGYINVSNEKNCLGIHVDMQIKMKCEDEQNSVPPDHHARRPMNAFLIFCKRHRGIVKEKYKNSENRSITKILGEWWASLDTNEKKCYVSLAKQNKDAFFSANPNFKWYKLPAPSLRTLNTRPCDIERFFESSNEYIYDDVSPVSSQMVCATCSRSDLNKNNYFKLADENQMGELNNLIRPNINLPSIVSHQQTLVTHYDHLRTGCKKESGVSLEVSSDLKHSNSDKDLLGSDIEDDRAPKKWTRSCKGKKYQEFITSGQIIGVSPKRPTASKKNIAHNGTSKCFVNEAQASKNESIKDKKLLQKTISKNSSNFNKFQCKQTCSFLPFDLEDKISALPAQCLDTYLQRKKCIKRKKINSKQRNPSKARKQVETSSGTSQLQVQTTKNAQGVKEHIMVGSQKRKARKESITRREISSVKNDIQLLMGKNSSIPQAFITVNQNATSDLFILAEVAANHTDNS